jgi:UDP-N-acetylmuramoylalanine--D-glutamate ligase
VLNISADHMDRYRDLNEYAATKASLYTGCEIMVINRDDPWVAAMAVPGAVTFGFTLGRPAGNDFGIDEIDGGKCLCVGRTCLMPVSELPIPGRHNQANALAALALGSAVGLPQEEMLTALKRFSGLPHRTQWISGKGGVDWYNDSKGTNVGATIAALEGLHPENGASRSVLIAGGDCKDADFSPLASVVEKTARAVVLIGRDAPRLQAALAGSVALAHASTLEEAVAVAAQLARPGDRVLLSPACASFDMFRNFEARGEAFIQAVGALAL